MICPHCNLENRETARFCLHCGASLTPQPSTSPIDHAPEAPADQWDQGASPSAPPAHDERAEQAPLPPDRPGETVPLPPEVEPSGDAAPPPSAPPVAQAPGAPTGQAPSPPAHQAQEEQLSAPTPHDDYAEQEQLPAMEPFPKAPISSPQEGYAITEQADLLTPTDSIPVDLTTSTMEKESPQVTAAEQPDVAGQAPGLPLRVGELPPGTMLIDRYEIVSAVTHEADAAVYHVQDYGRCWACHMDLATAEPEAPQPDGFCPACGAELSQGIKARLREQLEPIQDERAFELNGRWYLLVDEEPAKEIAPFAGGVSLEVGFCSHVGQTYAINQDSLVALNLALTFEGQVSPALGLFAVADGIGGHQDGQLASRKAIRWLTESITWQVLLSEVRGDRCLEETLTAALMTAVQGANTQLFAYSQNQTSDLGSTLAAAIIRDDLAVIANVGDSRAYLWHDDQLEQITSDHSAVARLVKAGEISPQEAYTHPQRGAIYRSLGDNPTLKVDTFTRQLQPYDRLILCCDGLWETLRDEGIEKVLLLEPNPQRAADEMVRRANLAGGPDNISVIVVAVSAMEKVEKGAS